jgi:hypothetical protein
LQPKSARQPNSQIQIARKISNPCVVLALIFNWVLEVHMTESLPSICCPSWIEHFSGIAVLAMMSFFGAQWAIKKGKKFDAGE